LWLKQTKDKRKKNLGKKKRGDIPEGLEARGIRKTSVFSKRVANRGKKKCDHLWGRTGGWEGKLRPVLEG